MNTRTQTSRQLPLPQLLTAAGLCRGLGSQGGTSPSPAPACRLGTTIHAGHWATCVPKDYSDTQTYAAIYPGLSAMGTEQACGVTILKRTEHSTHFAGWQP